MRDLNELGIKRTRQPDPGVLSSFANATGFTLPPEFVAVMGFALASDSPLGYKFLHHQSGEEWEGMLTEFAIWPIESEVVKHDGRSLLALGADPGGNYVYLELSAEPMRIVEVEYSSGTISVVADSLSDFLQGLYVSEE